VNKHEGRSFDDARAEIAGRHVTADAVDGAPERFEVYRLCECAGCLGAGKVLVAPKTFDGFSRCPDCRGEGRTRDLVATATDEQAVGVAIVTLAREGEFTDCPFGLLDTLGETGQKWLILPWGASPRNVSDAGRVLANSKKEKTT
jgi:hypothetical protein